MNTNHELRLDRTEHPSLRSTPELKTNPCQAKQASAKHASHDMPQRNSLAFPPAIPGGAPPGTSPGSLRSPSNLTKQSHHSDNSTLANHNNTNRAASAARPVSPTRPLFYHDQRIHALPHSRYNPLDIRLPPHYTQHQALCRSQVGPITPVRSPVSAPFSITPTSPPPTNHPNPAHLHRIRTYKSERFFGRCLRRCDPTFAHSRKHPAGQNNPAGIAARFAEGFRFPDPPESLALQISEEGRSFREPKTISNNLAEFRFTTANTLFHH